MSDIKTIVVLRDIYVAVMLRQGETAQATEVLGGWKLTEETFDSNYLTNGVEAEETFTLGHATAWLSEQWDVLLSIERVYEWRSLGKFPNAVNVPVSGSPGHRWYVPKSDLVAFAASHTYVSRTPV